MPTKTDVSTVEEIKKLYVVERSTIKEIASQLSICEMTVGKYLYGIKKRTYKGREPPNKKKVPKRELERVYNKTGSSRETAKYFGMTKTTVLSLLREFGISVKEPGSKGEIVELICPNCKRKFELPMWKAKKQKFCSFKCGVEYHRGKVRYSPIKCAGKKIRYRQPRITKDGKKIEIHRLLMEEKIGRKLTPSEHIHHIDMDPSNNSIENLYLYANARKHGRGHYSMHKLIKSLIEDRVIGFEFGKYFRIDGKIAEG